MAYTHLADVEVAAQNPPDQRSRSWRETDETASFARLSRDVGGVGAPRSSPNSGTGRPPAPAHADVTGQPLHTAPDGGDRLDHGWKRPSRTTATF